MDAAKFSRTEKGPSPFPPQKVPRRQGRLHARKRKLCENYGSRKLTRNGKPNDSFGVASACGQLRGCHRARLACDRGAAAPRTVEKKRKPPRVDAELCATTTAPWRKRQRATSRGQREENAARGGGKSRER